MRSTRGSGKPEERPRQFVTGIRGWFARRSWRRRARKMSEEQVGELRKMLIIIERQAAEMPISSKLHKRRMEILREQERLEYMIAQWEAVHVP